MEKCQYHATGQSPRISLALQNQNRSVVDSLGSVGLNLAEWNHHYYDDLDFSLVLFFCELEKTLFTQSRGSWDFISTKKTESSTRIRGESLKRSRGGFGFRSCA